MTPILISFLVGIACGETTLGDDEDCSQLQETPNRLLGQADATPTQSRSVHQATVEELPASEAPGIDKQASVLQQEQRVMSSPRCSLTSSITMPAWLLHVLGPMVDVEIFCDFPKPEHVSEKIAAIEKTIVKRSGLVRLRPGEGLEYKHVAWGMSNKEFVAANRIMEALSVEAEDTCANSTFAAAATAEQIYNNIKAMIDVFDIFTKCTKSYVPKGELAKDDVMGIAVMNAFGIFTLSFEDIAHYDEDIDGDKKTLTVVVTSRKGNVVEGNYDFVVKLRNGFVDLKYTKRQNFAENVHKMFCDHDCYQVETQQSVDRTILKLASAGIYGMDAVNFHNPGACYQDTSECVGFSTKQVGESCTDNDQCRSNCCGSTKWWSFSKQCVETC